MAVQEFGLPGSACPSPSAQLQGEIAQHQTALDQLAELITAAKQELDEHRGSKEQYNQKAAEYNQLVEQYNALLAQTKAKINEYNAQVAAYNSCASG